MGSLAFGWGLFLPSSSAAFFYTSLKRIARLPDAGLERNTGEPRRAPGRLRRARHGRVSRRGRPDEGSLGRMEPRSSFGELEWAPCGRITRTRFPREAAVSGWATAGTRGGRSGNSRVSAERSALPSARGGIAQERGLHRLASESLLTVPIHQLVNEESSRRRPGSGRRRSTANLTRILRNLCGPQAITCGVGYLAARTSLPTHHPPIWLVSLPCRCRRLREQPRLCWCPPDRPSGRLQESGQVPTPLRDPR